MSNTIDQKVVEMRFDNRHFEQNVSQTMSSIDKLNNSLQFKGSTKGLSEVSDASKQTSKSLEDLEYTSYKAGFRWSDVLSKISSVVEWNIARKAVDMLGTSIKNLGDQMLGFTAAKAGFDEYELKMGSIQTIMAGTGEDLETVNGYLNDLNEYSDKTIYSFADMTQNIGKFTNAGISLKDSVAAIKGVANVAAVSGANSNEASRAMYNFSQALSSGYVKLVDWKSIELANMGTVEFKQQLIDTAVELGTVTKAADGTYKTLSGKTFSATKSFNDVLQEQWMTSEVLTTTLGKYSDNTTEIGKKAEKAATEVKTFSQMMDTLKESAQSGWAQTWELIFGDFEEGKQLWTELSEIFGGIIEGAADSRNELLSTWKEFGGRDDLLDSLRNIVDAIGAVIKPIKSAFTEMFPPLTAKKLLTFTERLKDFTKSLVMSDETADKVRRTFRGIFAVLELVGSIFAAVAKAAWSLGEHLGFVGGSVLDVTATFGDWLVNIVHGIKNCGILNKTLDFTVKVIEWILDRLKSVGSFVKSVFQSGPLVAFRNLLSDIWDAITGVADGTTDLKSTFVDAFTRMGQALENSLLWKTLKLIWEVLATIGQAIVNVFTSLVEMIGEKINTKDWAGLLEIFNALLGAGAGFGLLKLIQTIKERFADAGGIISTFTEFFETLGDTLKSFQSKLKSETLVNIAKALLMIVAAVIVMAFIPAENLTRAVVALGILLTELLLILKLIKPDEVRGFATTLLAMSAAVLILAASCAIIAAIDPERLWTAVGVIAGFLGGMVGAMAFLSKCAGQVQKGAGSMLILAFAIKMLIPFVLAMAFIPWENLARAGAAFSVAMAALIGGIVVLSKIDTTKAVVGAASLAIICLSLNNLIPFLLAVAFLPWESLGKAGAAMGVALVGLVGSITILSLINPTKAVVGAASLGIVCSSLYKLIPFLLTVAFLPWESLGKAGAAMGVALVGLVGAVAVLSLVNPAKAAVGAASIGILCTSLNMLIPFLVALSMLSWEAIGKAGAALAGTLVILVGAIAILSLLGTNAVIGASAIAILSASILMVTSALLILAMVPTLLLAKSILAIAAAFAVLGVAGLLLSPLIVPILAISAALLVVGAAMVAIGAGTYLFASGIAILVAAIASFITVVGLMAGSIDVIGSALSTLVASLVSGVIKGILDGITLIVQSLEGLLIAVLKALINVVPTLAELLVVLLLAVLKAVGAKSKDLTVAFLEVIIGIIQGIAEMAAPLIDAIVDLFVGLFKGVCEALGNMETGEISVCAENIGLILLMMTELAAMTLLAIPAMAGITAMGLVVAKLSALLAVMGAIAQIPGVEWLVKEGGNFLHTIGTSIGKFVGGLVDSIAGSTGSLSKIATDLSSFMTELKPFVEGVKQIDESVILGVANLSAAMLAMLGTSMFEKLTSFLTGGSVSIEMFATQLVILGAGIKSFSDIVTGVDESSVKVATNALTALAEMTHNIPNSGGLIAWITGDNSIAKFGAELIALGIGIKGFSDAVSGINADNISVATKAAVALANMADHVPNSGGIVSWITGDNSIANFGMELIALGIGIRGFADAVAGINAESVDAATQAAIGLAGIADHVPNQGGVAAWFAGDNSVALFGAELISLGIGLKGFSMAVEGINTENVTAAASAAKKLAEMASVVPNQGGVAAWFAGENSIANFAFDLVSLGRGLKGFSVAVEGINIENVTAAATAAKKLAEITSTVPNEGGMKAWFMGESSVASFAGDLPKLGRGLKSFSTSIEGINSENMTAAANAAKTLAEMTKCIPSEGGMKAWFTGEDSIASFGGQLPKLGKGLKGFSDSVAGINAENLTAASKAAKTLAEMTKTTPGDTSKLVPFGENLVKFGGSLKSYFDKTKGITADAIGASSKAIKAAKDASTLNASGMSSAASAIEKLVSAIKKMADINEGTVSGFAKAMSTLGKTGVDSLVKSFDGLDKTMTGIGKSASDSLAKGVKSKNNDVKKAGSELANNVADGIEDEKKTVSNAAKSAGKSAASGVKESYDSFYSAGSYLVTGFANGISENKFRAAAKAKAMANAAEKAAKEALDINSPSKVFREIGTSVPEGFAMGIDKLGGMVKSSSVNMAKTAISNVKDSVARISDAINSDIDAQPTIRPVLDLSDVRAGANGIASMFGSGATVGVMANVGSINSMMNRNRQNGTTDDVISAIDNLSRKLDNVGNTYNSINGITYDDGSNIATAVKEIVRVAKMERRV